MLLSIIFAYLFLFIPAFAAVLPRQGDTGGTEADAALASGAASTGDVASAAFVPVGILAPGRGSGGAIARGRPLYSAAGDNICMDVQGAHFEEGTPVQAWWCNGTPAQRWVYSHGDYTLRLSKTNFCLDASFWPEAGTQTVIRKCSPGSSAQSWYYDPKHHRVQLSGTSLCLEVPDRGEWVGNVLDLRQCGYSGGRFQVWRENQ